MNESEHGKHCINPDYNPVFYFFGRGFTNLAFNLIWRRQTCGREHIPPMGRSVIFAANHRSLADPNLVGTSIGYPIHFFAKAELFDVPVLGWYIRKVNAFPVRRIESDISAFKTAQRILKNNEGLLLFPEGGRRLEPEKQFVGKAGVGMLACKTGATVVPVGIVNSDKFPRLTKLQVRFGKPMTPPASPTKDDYQRFSDEIMARIQDLCR